MEGTNMKEGENANSKGENSISFIRPNLNYDFNEVIHDNPNFQVIEEIKEEYEPRILINNEQLPELKYPVNNTLPNHTKKQPIANIYISPQSAYSFRINNRANDKSDNIIDSNVSPPYPANLGSKSLNMEDIHLTPSVSQQTGMLNTGEHIDMSTIAIMNKYFETLSSKIDIINKANSDYKTKFDMFATKLNKIEDSIIKKDKKGNILW